MLGFIRVDQAAAHLSFCQAPRARAAFVQLLGCTARLIDALIVTKIDEVAHQLEQIRLVAYAHPVVGMPYEHNPTRARKALR